ncbi:MAG: carboxypeptidase-like regulatory domain-containing protein, partial [Ignavibacteriales bacterium]
MRYLLGYIQVSSHSIFDLCYPVFLHKTGIILILYLNHKMKIFFKIFRIVILLIIFVSTSLFGQNGGLRGKVTDGSNPLPFVNIILLNTNFGTSSEEDGTFVIRNIPAESYKVKFSAVGYESKTIDIIININRTLELNVELIQQAIEVGTVEIFGNQSQSQDDTRTSLIDLNPNDAKIIPGATEDVFRTLQSLPGVLAPNDFSSQLIIRGSGPDQNLIIMDDIEVFNPYRLYGV